MSGSSQEAAVQFTRSSISAKQEKKPSAISLGTTSSSSIEKDQLLDEYQAKMGEMLKCQQELCTVKGQLRDAMDTVQQKEKSFHEKEVEYQSQIAAMSQRIQDLEASTDSKTKENVEQTGKAEKWKTRCHHYQEVIAQQSKELKEKDEKIESLEILIEEMKKDHAQELENLRKQLSVETDRLKQENQDLMQQTSSASESLADQQKRMDSMNEENQKLEKAVEKIKKERDELRAQFKHATNESSVHQSTIVEQQSIIQKLRHQKEKYKDQCRETAAAETQIKSQREKLTNLEAELSQEREKYEELEQTLANEMKKTKIASRLFSKIAELVGNPETPKEVVRGVVELYKENQEWHRKRKALEKEKESCEGIREDNSRLSSELKCLQKRVQLQLTKLKISESIEQARKKNAQYITTVASRFGFGSEETPLRAVITTILIARRLSRYQLGSSAVEDGRSWWWLGATQAERLEAHMLNSSTTLSNVQEDNKTLTEALSKAREENGNLKSLNDEYTQKLKESEESNKFLHSEIRNLNDELSSLVDADTYQSLQAEFIQKKKDLKKALAQLRDITKERNHLTDQLEEANTACEDQAGEIALLQGELEVAQSKLRTLSEEVQILHKAQLAKTKELLSLERGIHKEKVTNDRNTAQCHALALENQQLFNQLHPSKAVRTSDPGTRLGLRATKTLL